MSSKKDAKIAGLIMAAGGSSRLDSPKQLLKWGNDYLINHIISTVKNSGVQQVHVVLGSCAEKIRAILPEGSIRVLINQEWHTGMSSSIKVGILSLEKNVEGCFIFLADQPFIHPALIREMIAIFENENAEIISPRVNGKQSNPVLFRRSFFPQLLTVSGDRGAKQLIAENGARWLDWPDERLLLDIDSKADYQTALARNNS